MHSLSEDLLDFIQLSRIWSDGNKFQRDFDKLTTVGLDAHVVPKPDILCWTQAPGACDMKQSRIPTVIGISCMKPHELET